MLFANIIFPVTALVPPCNMFHKVFQMENPLDNPPVRRCCYYVGRGGIRLTGRARYILQGPAQVDAPIQIRKVNMLLSTFVNIDRHPPS
jgi:hypothetical protein